MKTIRVIIKNGETRIETSGFVGSSCQDATRSLEAVLGKTVTDTPTEEAYVQSKTQDQ